MDITQVFTVDVSQAVANLGLFRDSLGQVNAQLGRTAGSSAQGAASQVANVGTAASTSSGQVRSLTVSWQTLTRVVATQLIVSTFGRIRRELAGAVETAAELEERIALIQTLQNRAPARGQVPAGQDFQTAGEIQEEVLAISTEFNIPLIETATAAYDALSNQLGTLEESLAFVDEAAQFSRATNSSLTDSVDLLSAAIVSYDLDLSQTAETSSLFFNLIDQGRITADELANTFGRVGAPARQLGIPLDELAGVIANISVQGFQTSESITQFRGIIRALASPTNELTAAIQNLGFANAQTATEQIGVLEVLRRLEEQTQGSAEAFSELFPNVRGSTGALSLLARNAGDLEQSFTDLQNSSDELANSRASLVLQTDAELLANTFNDLQNRAVGLGTQLLDVLGDFTRFAGGPAAVADGISELIITLGILTPALVAVTVGATGATGALTALSAATAANAPLLALSGLLVIIIDQFRSFQQENLDNFLGGAREAAEEFNVEATRTQAVLNGILRTSNQETRASGRRVSAFFADIAQSALGSRDDLIRASEDITNGIENSLDSIVSAQEQYVAELRNAARDAERAVEESQTNITDLNDSIEQRNFDFSISGLGDIRQIDQLSARAERLASEAARTLRNAGGDDDAIARGRALFAQSQQEAERAASIAQSAGNRRLEGDAIARINRLQRDQIRSEEALAESQERRRQVAEEEAERQQNIVDLIQEQVDIVLDNSSPLDDNNQPVSDSVAQQQTEARNNALNRIQELGREGNFDLAQTLGLGDFINRFRNDLQAPVTIRFEVEEALRTLEGRLQQTFQGVTQRFSEQIAAISAFTGDPIENETEIGPAITEVNTQQDDLERRTSELTRSRLEQANAAEVAEIAERDFAAAIVESRGQLSTLASIAAAQLTGGEAEIVTANNIFRDFQEAAEDGALSVSELRAELAEARQELGLQDDDLVSNQSAPVQGVLGVIQDRLDVAIAAESVASQESQLNDLFPPDAIQRLREARNAINEIDVITQRERGDIVSNQASLNAGNVSTSLARIAALDLSNLAPLNNLPSEITINTNNANPDELQFGRAGVQFFNNGGFASRGVDTIPALLAPGESVINARSTQRFFSQIQALNAGQTPVFRAQNGGTTTIGDISVTVQGDSGGNNAKTGRQIAQSLNRELRRRTSRLQ